MYEQVVEYFLLVFYWLLCYCLDFEGFVNGNGVILYVLVLESFINCNMLLEKVLGMVIVWVYFLNVFDGFKLFFGLVLKVYIKLFDYWFFFC